MELSAFLILMTASAVNMALPGPGIVLAFTRAACGGLPAAAAVSAGLLLSSLILALAAVAILAGLMGISPDTLSVVRWIGLGVILWIALRLVFVPARPARATAPALGTCDLLAGLALGVTSPFNLVFLLALLPQFAPDPIGVESAAALIAACLTGQLLVLAAVSSLGVVAGHAVLRGPGVRAFERIAGASLAAFAIALMGASPA